MQRKPLILLAIALLPGLVACFNEIKKPAQEGYFKPTATVQDIMLSLIDPSADGIWNSVSTTITKTGTEDKQPRTDQEWQEVRRHAITLIEGGESFAHQRPAGSGQRREIGESGDRGRPGGSSAIA